MNAILYVAGRATRLGALASHRNKVLLEFAGKSLFERHVMNLKSVGVAKLYVVTGHLREILSAHFAPMQQKYGVEIIELHNPDFTEGSVLSMHVSLPVFKSSGEPLLVMDGDVLYDARFLQRLANSPHRTALLLDRDYSTIDDDPVLVPVINGRPFDFVKKWTGTADSIGEGVGFHKIDPADFPILIRETEARIDGVSRNDSLDDVLRVMVKADLFGAEDVTGLPWTEIDFPHDLDYAAKTILPALQGE